MLGNEPEGLGVFCLSSEVWERALEYAYLIFLSEARATGRQGRSCRDQGCKGVGETAVHYNVAFLSFVSAQVFELLLCARPCVR